MEKQDQALFVASLREIGKAGGLNALREVIRLAIIELRNYSVSEAREQEIEATRHDRVGYLALAARLFASPELRLTAKEQEFLETVRGWRGSLTPPQASWLLRLRDDAALHHTINKTSVSELIQECFKARDSFEITEEEFELIVGLNDSGRDYMVGWQLDWFKDLCRRLGVAMGPESKTP